MLLLTTYLTVTEQLMLVNQFCHKRLGKFTKIISFGSHCFLVDHTFKGGPHLFKFTIVIIDQYFVLF